MNIDYIEGSIKNGRSALKDLVEKARLSGAHEIRIQATIANEGLYVLPRLGFTQVPGKNGYTEQFVYQIMENQIPK